MVCSGYPCPRFKIIVLDEADTMTPEAQSALRRIIETYSKVTRFCLICNYVTRVIEPLASRCAKFRFKPLPVQAMRDRMVYIAGTSPGSLCVCDVLSPSDAVLLWRCYCRADRENVQLGEGTLDAVMRASNGDMRKAVTFLQSAHQLCLGQGTITAEMVVDISGQVPASTMTQLWARMAGQSFDTMKAEVAEVVYQGFPMSALLSQLHDEAVRRPELSDLDKALICEKIAEVTRRTPSDYYTLSLLMLNAVARYFVSQADQCLVDGSCEALQLLDVAAFIMRRLTKFSAAADAMSASNH